METVASQKIEEIVEALKNGKIVVFPTETTYGFGCDAFNQEAVDLIFKIKGRRSDKPLLVVVPNIEMAKEYLEWSESVEELANKFWPGALTIVGLSSRLSRGPAITVPTGLLRFVARNDVLANGVIANDGTIAVRVTAFEFLQKISNGLGRPIVATSANLAEAGEIYSAEEIKNVFANREFAPDILVDAGELPKNLPTTIVSVVGDEIKIIRQGSVYVE